MKLSTKFFDLLFRELWALLLTIADPLVEALLGLLEILGGFYLDWVRTLAGAVSNLLLGAVDFFEDVVSLFSGTAPVSFQGESMYLLDALLTSNGVMQAFMAISLLAFIVCMVFTIFAVVRSMGDSLMEEKRPVGAVLAQALKSGISFLLIPFMVFLGSQLCSIVLTATEHAITMESGASQSPRLSTYIFLSGTYGIDSYDRMSELLNKPDYKEGERAQYLKGNKDRKSVV